MNTRLLILPFFIGVITIHAQINGTVTDSKTKKVLADVEVFFHERTLFAITTPEGKFDMGPIDPGFADVVLYKKGYQLFKSSIRIQEGKSYILNLSLDRLPQKKKTKLAKVDDWSGALQNFLDLLLGKYNESCSIMNPEVLSFTKGNDGITVTTSDPILIDNNSMGYHILYYLQSANVNNLKPAIKGYYSFLPMQADNSNKLLQWEANRLKAYLGSERHFYKSMVSLKTEPEGFSVTDKRGGQLKAETLIQSSISNYHKLLFDDTVNIRYKAKSGEVLLTQLIPRGGLQINDEGILLIPENRKISGAMSSAGLIHSIPQDYQPQEVDEEQFFRYYEKIYVHTDKPYYYSGEPLWFKGYINYAVPAMRDSLSRVVYIELISSKKQIALSKMLRIDSGFFYGDFMLPDTLAKGAYYLRAYTNLNRNFTGEDFFMKPVRILSITDKVEASQGKLVNEEDLLLSITADKPRYKTREKIQLTLRVQDQKGRPIGSNISVSVTDAKQVVPLASPVTISAAYPLEKGSINGDMEFNHTLETGIGFSGRFLNEKGKPEKIGLTILQIKPRNMMLTETNQEGLFSLQGLQFDDSTTFSIKSDKARDLPYGKVEVVNRAMPPVKISIVDDSIKVVSTEMPQRLVSEYEVPIGSQLLEAVEVKAKRIRTPVVNVNHTGNFAIYAKDLNTSYGNLLLTLPGKFPGLIISQGDAGYVVYTMRGRTSSLSNPKEVMVKINDVVMGGAPGDILSMIDPNTIESIDFTSRITPQWAFGILSIYTKKDFWKEDEKTIPNFQLIKLQGYSTPREFKYPDYSDPATDKSRADYRATVYWNPEITTDQKSGTTQVSFFAADLAGRYRVVGEGVTEKGEAVRCVYFIEVDND